MNLDEVIESLIVAGRDLDFKSIASIPGAGIHREVLNFSDSLRDRVLERFINLPVTDRVAFIKALAVYEDTVGGLGSVTALRRLLPLIDDKDRSILDWILSTTRSYWYFAHSAKSYAEFQTIERAIRERRAINFEKEAERERIAKARKAEIASGNLFNAIRRGDIKAVEALLRQGASPHGVTPDGVPLTVYAADRGSIAIAELLHSSNISNDAGDLQD